MFLRGHASYSLLCSPEYTLMIEHSRSTRDDPSLAHPEAPASHRVCDFPYEANDRKMKCLVRIMDVTPMEQKAFSPYNICRLALSLPLGPETSPTGCTSITTLPTANHHSLPSIPSSPISQLSASSRVPVGLLLEPELPRKRTTSATNLG